MRLVSTTEDLADPLGELISAQQPIGLDNFTLAMDPHRLYRVQPRALLGQKAGLWQDHGLVFPSVVGTPLSHRNVVRAFKELLKHAELPQSIRLYDLRHTCATLLLSSNVHPKYVQELLGHTSIALTFDTYSHVLKGMDGGIGGPWTKSQDRPDSCVAVQLMHEIPDENRGSRAFPLFAGSLEVSRPGLEPGT